MSRPTTPARHAARTPGTVRRRLASAALAAAATVGVTVGTAGTVTADAEPAAPAPAAAPAPEAAPDAAPAGPAMHAGSTIIMGTTRGPVGECTLSDIAGADGQLYGVTAGHCVDPAVLGEPITAVWSEDGDLIWSGDPSTIRWRHEPTIPADSTTPQVTDYAVFPLAPGVTDTHQVSSHPTSGIAPGIDAVLRANFSSTPRQLGEPLPVDQVRVGETVCKDGSRTGRTCGPVLGVNPVSQDIVALIPALSGDSGGALTVNRGGTWHPVGILSGGSPLLFNVFDSTTQALNG
ncbi:hypothetical protein QP948_05010 [Corynebacterium bovis]|uniref:hypothetical protein n=1 Tax=Corynebacterium bovis TaxID=36808 RepID=UPI00254C152C|nr:hypothetical protein [Corynebacterium bovis]MDK8510765.1 hypothetical protein [Corynebacterium bovis]